MHDSWKRYIMVFRFSTLYMNIAQKDQIDRVKQIIKKYLFIADLILTNRAYKPKEKYRQVAIAAIIE